METRIDTIHELCGTQILKLVISLPTNVYAIVGDPSPQRAWRYVSQGPRLDLKVAYCPTCRHDVPDHQVLSRKFSWQKDEYRDRS